MDDTDKVREQVREQVMDKVVGLCEKIRIKIINKVNIILNDHTDELYDKISIKTCSKVKNPICSILENKS